MQDDRAKPENEDANFRATCYGFATQQAEPKQEPDAQVERQGKGIHDGIGHKMYPCFVRQIVKYRRMMAQVAPPLKSGLI